ncbi:MULTISPECIES: sugar transferase [Nocardioides]|uniref:Sugar transferase n=1 Tax=Nocardioides vastitatis TaxID=2568655 RepID=A0ABW0ZBX7_9ACTN|nr:sugar transferase [Nocardioides sp.]THJ02296.1 sugar transferase [Nocardioides sp.]
MTVLERTRLIAGSEPSRTLRYLPGSVLAVDVVALAVTALLATLGRERLTIFSRAWGAHEELGVVATIAIVAWIGIIAVAGGYRRDLFGSGSDEFKRVVNASLVTAGVLGVGCYLAKYDFSRGFFLLAFAIGPLLLLLGRFSARKALHALRRRGFLQARVLVAGSARRVDEVTQVLRREKWLGYSVLGAVTPAVEPLEETATGVPVLGDKENVVEIGRAHGADIIFFAGGTSTSAAEMNQHLWALEGHGIDVVVAPSLQEVSQQRLSLRPIGGLPLIHVDQPTWVSAGRIGKRIFDVVGSFLLILALSPILLVAATQIFLHDRGPLLFKHYRIGRNGKRFGCLKFRTMVVNAEAMVKDLQVETGQQALLFKLKNDPRVTKPGHWLRRFSVDELPQLLNVLRGDMSLVGPRPQVQGEVDLYQGAMERRLLVRPGMTGLWQVSGRNDLTPEEAMRLDVYYVDNWSMMQDISILLRTFTAVTSSRGAY